MYKLSLERRLYLRGQAKKSREKLRASCLEAYGNRCKCCGEKIARLLTIDRISQKKDNKHYKVNKNGNGKHKNGQTLYRWLRKNNYPKGYQVLCLGCNYAKFLFGSCPHKDEKYRKTLV